MAGEAQHTYAVKELDAESKLQDEGTLEQHSDKSKKDSSEHFPSTGTEARTGGRGAKIDKLEKERDYTQQREAVIRPQQAGKIDFRSLQNRPKFATDRTWPSGKSSPQSPSAKSRSREKGKRSGKSERGNPQQLYRLSITNPRSNPTIGIAYPQQKVSPPKKLEASRGPVSGSYRFHVPSIPEREAELQQEELNYNRCFQEASSNLTSPSYTSQALGSTGGNSTHQHPSLSQQQQQQQQSTPMENNSSQPSSQLLLTDFQMSGSNAWQSPERTFNGANYGISSQKSTPLTEVNKEGSFVSVPFQFGYQFLEDSTSNPFPCEQNSQTQDFTDSSLGSGHVTHASFSFASGDGQEVTQNNTQYSKEQQPEDRNSYTQPPQSTQYVQAPQGAASSLHCPRSQSEDSASSDSSGPSSVGQLEQGKSALPESTEVFGQGDSRDPAITSGSKRNCHLKDTTANQRTLIQGRVQHSRSISQGQSPQVHFANKSYQSPPLNNIHLGPVPFDKNINNKVQNRLPHSWEGSNKTYSAVEQNTIQYGDLNEDFQFQNQPPLDQRSNSSKNGRMPWQQLRLTSAIPSQNRIDLSRQINNQKLSYMVSPSDWQDDNKSQKNGPLKSPSSFQNNKTNETFSNQSQDAVKHSTSTMSSFKLEVSHAQVCESKNKPVYFGMNQSLPGGSSRSFNYPQLQVPPVGLMMVSPYESPLPSPVHNPTSSSTCSSLSPASTSPVNLSSEDSQMSKAGAPPFYHQHQAKTQLASDHLSTNQHHFHSDVPRNLHYAPDRAKDNMMSYLQNSVNARTTIDGNKGYMDNFGMEHHQPPPPYSTHQLLATSLAANLDQLDVLLTCKQCDQNFNNLTSFLGHKQYCGQHAFAQIDLKEISKIEDSRKFHADISKAGSNGASTAISRCPSELHLSLLGLNKNGELMCDSETKGDNKEDPMKLSLFSGASNLPVSLPDLEMEDAKLDSLITEALNRLGYQSDNAEIDSSFIDAFADDDLTSVKATSSKQSLKTKESMVADSKSKTVKDVDRALTQGKYLYDSDESPQMHKQYTESTFEKISLNVARDKKNNIKKEVTHQDSGIASRGKSKERDIKGKDASKLFKSEEETSTPRFLFSSKFSEHCGIKSFQDSSEHRASTPSQASTTNQTSPTPRTPVKESKRKRSGGGTWSKELIHKIVQQKNKLHKLHVKGAKNLQFSLVMERLTPAVQNPAFGEYDYVSDSDDECEPVKIASQGRLSQSSRCKYTYTKECKWRARGEREQAAWRHESKECFQVKKSDEVTLSPEKHTSHQRLRRRGSRSSTSSDVSTSVSVSSDAINSPKSNDRTDSDSEKKMEVRRKECPEQKTYERLSSQKFCKEASTQIALTLTKCVKMSSTDQSLHSASKKDSDTLKSYNSNLEDYHPLPSSPKSRSASKNLDKYRSSLAISKQKYESHSRENGTFSYKINTPQRPDKTLHTEETTPSESTDIKDLEADSYSVTVKEIYFNEKNKSACSEGLKTTQPTLPDSSTFEKQNDNLCTAEETITPDEGFVPKSVSLCSSLMDEVCLSPTETQDPLLQKDTSHLIPYPLDQDQGLMKSPLSFDTSSVFGDLTVTGFDNGLYSDIPLQKEGFNSIENAIDKKEGFVSSFSPFLEQRDWGLMVDVSPVLPDEISQYKDNAEKSNEKKSDFNHIPLSLPEKIMDYSVNLNTCASDDELEIKRIVNELENQLQTTKLESPPLLDEDGKHLQMSKFSPLRLDEDSHHDGTALDIHCPVQTLDVPVNGMQSEHFADSVLPWSSPFQFELLGGHHSPHTPTHGEPDILEHFTAKEDDAMNIITKAIHVEPFQLHHDLKTKDTNIEKETAEETKDDILEQKRYTENLMKSLEVISDSIFKKESIMSDPDEMNVTTLKSQHLEIECQATDAIEREDHSEKEAITVKENILSPPNINERKGGIEFILNESRPSLSNSTHPAADGNQPIIFHPSEPVQNNINGTEIKVLTLVEVVDVADESNMIECLDIGMDCSYVAENTCDKSRALDTVNELFKNNTDDAEHLFTENREEEEEEEEGKGTNSQSESQSASVRQSALPDTGSELGKNEEETGLVDKSANIPSGPENIHSLPADERRGGSSDNVREETEIPVNMSKQDDLSDHAAPGNGSHAEFYTACHSTNMHMEVVIMEKPYSPILMERNIESINQCQNVQDYQSVNEESSPLTLSPSNHILESDVCTVALEQHKSEERFQSSNIQGHEAEVTNVKDIENYLPIPLMASQQCSPCGGNIDVEENLGIPHATPPASPILSTCPPTSLEKLSVQDGPREPQSKCSGITIDQESLQDMHSLKVEGDNQNEPLTTGAEMDYTMMNPPHLDLGITDCKIPSAEASMPSPPSLNSTAEPLEASEDFPKTDSLYDFKLSPLNYNDISNDPPQLNHYDFIPISLPANAEDKADSEQSSRRCSKPCDVSVDPGLIFNKNATVLESDVSLNSDAPTKQSLPDEPLIASAVQESLKSARITLDFPPQNESTQLNSSSNNVMKDLEVYHKPLESIEYLHIHGNLLRKVESENIDSHKAPCVPDSALLKEDISDGFPTSKPLVLCGKEQMNSPQQPTEKQPPVESNQPSTTHQVQREISPKNISGQSSMQQGKALCDICSMCFRTVPGLKRHKAMKHLVKADKNAVLEDATPSLKDNMLSFKEFIITEKGLKDESQTCFQTKIDGLCQSLYSETSNNFLTSNSAETDLAPDRMATDKKTTVAVNETGHHMPSLSAKAKKHYKSKKNKMTEVNNKSDPFSNELLNILKTDILQAITPVFQNRALQERSKSPVEQVKIDEHTNKDITETEPLPFSVASNSESESVSRCPTMDTKINDREQQNKTDAEEMKFTGLTEKAKEEKHCTDISKDCSSEDKLDFKECDEPSKNVYVVEMCEESEEKLAKEILRKVSVEIKCENSGPVDEVDPLACLNSSPLSPHDMSADLKALLDDDTTFSQLFPRDDEDTKRKKCPRVYSKKNKKQKLSPNPHLLQEYHAPNMPLQKKGQHVENQTDETFVNNQNNHLEYESISIDDAIMLNMCHNSSLKADGNALSDINQSSVTPEGISKNPEELRSSLVSPNESTIDKSTIVWSAPSDSTNCTADPVVSSEQSSTKEDVPITPCSDKVPPAPFPLEPCVTDNISTFQSIDIQNIKTTFQLPEIQFFDSSKDIPVGPPTTTTTTTAEMENKDVEKSKKTSERRGRKRKDVNLKVKDKEYKCKVCFTWFLTLGELNFHKLSHNPSPPPTCYMCVQRKFSSREQLRDHLREKHAKNKAGIWTCGMCLKEISDVWMYNEHLREHATQFARKGQTQGSMLGIPGCFMQETAVKNFITSIMQHRPSRTNRESIKISKEQDKGIAKESTVGEIKTTETVEPKVHKTKSSNGTSEKPLEVLHKTDAPKNVEMHPNCKDPSRDCHHCGKQFPKPFKLQRHLVVHNLEKIFLCHKCPVSYQEAQELKDHLKRAHEEVEELDSKHTTLYTCELCADVMHVIKKSFICSTCNYTFSKKEQFDRHMEKHLSGGNKIFKFRGVLRPVKASASKVDECGFPASKKRKILNDSMQENSSDSGIASIGSLHLNTSSEMQSSTPKISKTDDFTQTSTSEYRNTNVKTEDIAEDYSDLHLELEKCPFHNASTKKEEIDPSPSQKVPDKESPVKTISPPCDVKEEDESVCIPAERTPQSLASKENSAWGEEKVKEKPVPAELGAAEKRSESRSLAPSSEDSLGFVGNPTITKTPASEKNELAASAIDQRSEVEQREEATRTDNNGIKKHSLSNGAEQQCSSQIKEKPPPPKQSDGPKNSSNHPSPRATEATQVSKVSSHGSDLNDGRESLRQQKKRKEMRSPHCLQRISSPAARENLDVDAKAKKKFRPGKCESPSLQRKPEGPSDYAVLSSVRDDAVSNKIVSKYKTTNSGLQPKRSMLDNCAPKKAEVVNHMNGDYKAKKGPLGRSLHSPGSKGPQAPMNNSLNRSRPKMGVRSMESHSYRTAESQNHLLSQLFGQKLTSFKIPLRKDTSESIN